MPRCANSPRNFYKGIEPSPKGRGICAGGMRVGVVERGRDGKDWITARMRNNVVRWSPVKPAMQWTDVLSLWKNGELGPLNEAPDRPFMWFTTPVSVKMNNPYHQIFVVDEKLDVTGNHQAFNEHLRASNNKNAIAFPSISGNALLVVPTPKPGHDYASLWHFLRKAPVTQKREFLKTLAIHIQIMLEKGNTVFVNTHGKGVPYLHVRLDKTPVYYPIWVKKVLAI
jgi:hypothetical protein